MWYKIINSNVQISIFAKPNAKKSAILKITEEALHISLHAKPQDGEANKELIRFLSEVFDLPKSKMTLLRGEGSRYKQVVVPMTEGVKAFLGH